MRGSRGAQAHFALMEGLSATVPIGVLLRDRDGGEVRVGRDGETVVRYALSGFDTAHLRTGIDGAAKILEAAGAQRIFSSHSRWVAYEPGIHGSRASGVNPQISIQAIAHMGARGLASRLA
jgi:long-chain-alcohol oxidase